MKEVLNIMFSKVYKNDYQKHHTRDTVVGGSPDGSGGDAKMGPFVRKLSRVMRNTIDWQSKRYASNMLLFANFR